MYQPAQGYNYGALRDEDGYMNEIGLENVCCDSCRDAYLPKLVEEFGENAELFPVRCNEEEHFPNCFVCGKIIECGLTYQEQEPEHFLSVSDADFKEGLTEPYFAYQVWRLVSEFSDKKLVKALIQRVKKLGE